MNLLYLAFANSRHDPLPSLQKEDEAIYRALAPRALKQEVLLHRDSYASLAKVAEYITLFREHLFLFHYSGHAGRDALLLEEETASGAGIAGMLKQCPNLKVVVLNGCSTRGQVQRLLDNGVPVVIATSAPVEDMKAMRFGIRLYQALSEQATIQEAFDMAAAEVIAMDASMESRIGRQIAFDLESEDGSDKEPLWGIYSQPEQETVLGQGLPVQIAPPPPTGFEVNERLIESLWESLGDYSDAIQVLMTKPRITLPRKRMAILNSLPAPVAEHLRKLVVPVEDENDGYDTLSVNRLRQSVRAYQTVMEFITFTLMAQLWETFFEQGKLNIAEERKEMIRTFLLLQPSDQEVYDYLALIRNLKDVIEENSGHYFLKELEGLLQGLAEGSRFQQALFFLEVLKVRLTGESIAPAEVPELCRRAEECLADLLSAMAFLAKYALVSVQGIDVCKYRHTPKAIFKHIAVELRDLLGGLEVTEFDMQHFMDNQSILLLNEEEETFLNLSPLIIDANAFEEKTDVSKIYFVSHFDKGRNTYCFKPIYKPEKVSEWIYLDDKKYAIVTKQFDAFKQLLA
ncbi:MAG: CHAT domain-containing protein [Lewinellaceae bacterium]|nr:CHAT domain-containing protein [Lewinellaceae bacterium]